MNNAPKMKSKNSQDILPIYIISLKSETAVMHPRSKLRGIQSAAAA